MVLSTDIHVHRPYRGYTVPLSPDQDPGTCEPNHTISLPTNTDCSSPYRPDAVCTRVTCDRQPPDPGSHAGEERGGTGLGG